MATYANSSNQIAALKELYSDSNEYMKDLVYKENPFLALVPKNESADGFAGKYIPVPLEYGVPQGRSHSFANAQANQTATSLASFFVYTIQDYQLVTITNLLMEQTKSNAGAFVDAAKLQMDGGIRNITNNIAFELMGDGTGSRAKVASGTAPGGNVYVITLDNVNNVVFFEIGMTLVNATLTGVTIALGSTTGVVTKVDRANGIVTIQASGADAGWTTAGTLLAVQGDIVAGSFSQAGAQALCGLQAWLPKTTPANGENFWGVDRSVDPTRLAGLRYDASAQTIEEGLTNSLGFTSREGARPDLIIMDFASYTALVNALGAKVQYVQAMHDEVEVAFEGIQFQSAYGRVTVLADRNCPPQTAYILTMSTWKLRSLGKVPHILTYGMEGLEGLRVGNADALEIRIAYYGNLICSAPGFNCVVTLSA